MYVLYAIPNSEEGRRRDEKEIANAAYTNTAFSDDLKKESDSKIWPSRAQ